MQTQIDARAALGKAVDLLWPHRCLACDEMTESAALCGRCFREATFVSGAACLRCGAPLPGEAAEDADCDDCLAMPRAWGRGRAALVYAGTGRRLVLGLKHADRLDLAPHAAAWMARAAGGMLTSASLLVPVPLHWMRLARRRYNQSSLLAREIAHLTGARAVHDLLVRARRTRPLDGMSVEARGEALRGAIRANPRRIGAASGRDRKSVV